MWYRESHSHSRRRRGAQNIVVVGFTEKIKKKPIIGRGTDYLRRFSIRVGRVRPYL
jgi:hypothetical protein